jgi:hypothetical protein
MEMSAEPSQAPSMRANPFKWVPVSTTAMFIRAPKAWALAKAASRTVLAWARVMSGMMVSFLNCWEQKKLRRHYTQLQWFG